MAGKQAKIVTAPMLRRMLRQISRSSSFPERDRAMILLSVKAGLRACEIAGLEWSMVLDARGRVCDTIHVRDLIAKKRRGRRIPMHPDLRRALEKLVQKVEPVGPVIRSYRGDHSEGEQHRELVRRAVPGARLRRLLVALWPAQLHHRRRPQHSSLGLQLARRAAARRPSVHRDHRTLHRRRHLGATEVGWLRLGQVMACEASMSWLALEFDP